jgi:hypothetical protein
MKTLSLTTAALAATLTLTACGGGGGGGAASTTYNIDAAYKLWIQQGQSVGLRGADACLGTLVHVQPPTATSSTFEGAPALATTVTRTTFVQAGCPLPSGIGTHTAYYATDYLPLGRSANGEYGVFASPPQFPTAAKVGEQGAVGTAQIYTDATRQQALGREDLSYVIEPSPAGATGAIVNLIARRYSTSSALQSTIQQRYDIAPGGALTLISEDIDGDLFTH